MIRAASTVTLLGLGLIFASGCGNQVPSVAEAQTGCGSTHLKVGQQAVLHGYLHGIRGTATIVDDCTIVIDGFYYDGIGLDVRVIGAQINEPIATGGVILTNNIRRVYTNETITVKLPTGVTLDQIDQIGIICKSFNINFGDGMFAVPG